MNERLKGIRDTVFGCALMVALPLAGMLVLIGFVQGAAWIGTHVLGWLELLSVPVFIVDVVVLLPLGAFRRTRPWAGVGLYVSSFVFGLVGWFVGFYLTYSLWGAFWTVVGLFFAGVGVLVTGLVAAGFNGMWGSVFGLIVVFLITMGLRGLGVLWMPVTKPEEEVIDVETVALEQAPD